MQLIEWEVAADGYEEQIIIPKKQRPALIKPSCHGEIKLQFAFFIFHSLVALHGKIKILSARNGLDLLKVIEAIKMRPTHSNIIFPGPGIEGYCLPISKSCPG